MFPGYSCSCLACCHPCHREWNSQWMYQFLKVIIFYCTSIRMGPHLRKSPNNPWLILNQEFMVDFGWRPMKLLFMWGKLSTINGVNLTMEGTNLIATLATLIYAKGFRDQNFCFFHYLLQRFASHFNNIFNQFTCFGLG